MYTAAVLENNSDHLLRWIAQSVVSQYDSDLRYRLPSGLMLPHHMTINLGKFDDQLNDKKILNSTAKLNVDQIFYHPHIGVCAAKVSRANTEFGPIVTKSIVPHITIAVKDGVSPKMSNQMLENIDYLTRVINLDQEYILDAFVEECD